MVSVEAGRALFQMCGDEHVVDRFALQRVGLTPVLDLGLMTAFLSRVHSIQDCIDSA